MSDDPNPRVSNGTCYTASGKELDSSFIPCGNQAFGHQTCCGKGDNCLADGACFGVYGTGYGSMLTYWAGCSDPDYQDASCPKKVVDQPWVALTYCDDNDGQWAICSQKGNPSTLQNGAFCSCTEAAKATIAFKDTETLSNLVSLPQNTGDTMSFFPNYSPSATVPTAGTTGGGGGGQATTAPPKTTVSRTLSETPSAEPAPSPSSPPPAGTGAIPSSTSFPLPPSSDSSSGSSSATTFTDANGQTTTATVTRTAASPNETNAGSGSNGGTSDDGSSESGGLNTGAKIGVGVGVAVGGVLLIALMFLLLRQRRNNRPAKGMEEGSIPSSEPKVPMADGAAIVEADGRPAKPHKLRGELGEEGASAAAAAAVGRRSSSKLKSRHRPRPSDDSAVSELEGSSLGGAGTGAAAPAEGYGNAAVPPGDELSPVAELPGTDVQQGGGRSYGRQLASDDSLVPAPLQIRRSEDGGGQGTSQPTTALNPPPAGPAAGRGAIGGSQSTTNGEARDEGAQVEPWGARWRRT